METQMSNRNIDHGIIETQFVDDSAADPEGSEVRNVEANTKVSRSVPPWVADEFGFVFRGKLPAGISEAEKALEMMKDSNWRFQAHAHVIDEVESQCQDVYNRYLKDLSTESGKKMVNGYYKYLKGLLVHAAEGEGGDQWCAYGLALSIMSQGCKEVASAVRFAQRAESWQIRLNEQGDTEQTGPTNMLMKAGEQATRGVAICESINKAYNSTVQDERAARLKLNFRTAAFTALGIEAASKAKDYDHPGKKLTHQAAAAGSAGTMFADFHGK